MKEVFIMDVADYMALPYHIVIQHMDDESGKYYFATVLELDGCMSDGATEEEAFKNIHEAMKGWMETKLEHGFPIPLPASANDYSGKFVVRIPKSLHAKLAREAEIEGVSLNQLALYKLSG
jgi:antitoxin HicB